MRRALTGFVLACAAIVIGVMGISCSRKPEPAASAAGDVRNILPDGPVAVVYFNGDHPDMDKTALSRIWNEPGMKEFFDPVWGAVREAIRKNVRPEQGAPDVLSLEPLLGTQLAVAIYAPAPPPPAEAPSGAEMSRARRRPRDMPQMIAVVRVGEEGARMRTGVERALAPMVSGAAEESAGAKLTPMMGGMAVYAFKDDLAVVGTPEIVRKALDEKSARLTKSEVYAEIAREAGLGGEVFGAYVDAREVLGLIGHEAREVGMVLGVLGLERMKGLACTWSPHGRGMMTTVYVSTPTDMGVIAGLKAGPVDERLLAMCPKAATTMLAFNLDMVKLYDTATHLAAQFGGAEVGDAIRQAEDQMGVRIRDELLASLDVGTMVTLTEGGVLLPNITVVQKLKDPAKADAAIGKLLSLGGTLANRMMSQALHIGPRRRSPAEMERMSAASSAELMSTTYKGVTIKYATVAVCSPAYAVKDGYLIAALSPLEVKDFLDVLERGTIAANADWTFVRGQMPMQGPQGIYYGEFRHSMKKLYYLLSTAGSLVTALEAVPVKLDVGKLPSPEQFASHLFGAGGTWQITDTGIKAQVFSPTGGALPVVGMAGLAVGALAPSVHSARAAARTTQCMSNLKMIGVILHQAAMDNQGQMPATLNNLENWGMTPRLLRCPQSDGSRACDYFYAPRRTGEAGSWEIIVACDLVPHVGGPGGERNVLFLDGHVQRMSAGEFETFLAKPQNQAFAEAFRKAGGR